MVFWLDWKLFGNGHGMASPHCDDVFYWLSGRFYQWVGGFGAQLKSYEWRIPEPGTRRRLIGSEFVVFQARRKWLRVEASWTRVPGVGTAEEVRELEQKLKAWGHGL